MKSILFVCTGNIFRSVVAEYAVKARVEPALRSMIGSAGIEAQPQPIHPLIRGRLWEKGIDLSPHRQRRVTRELLDRAHLVVAMGLDHRDVLRRSFGREALLFNQVCYGKEEPVLDLHEAIPDWQQHLDAAGAYVLWVVDYIWDAMPAFLSRVSRL